MHRETFEYRGIVHVLDINDYDEQAIEEWRDGIRERFRKADAGMPKPRREPNQ